MTKMKAIVASKFGPPESLQIRDVDKPSPKGREILIRIKATAINDYGWAMVRGKPVEFRFLYGFTAPKHPIFGMELAGTVEAIGPDATKFNVGDDVYGDISAYGFGTFAEFISIDENAVIRKPDGMPFTAAALPDASLLAYQALFHIGGLRDNMDVLINGAGGGVGMIGLQLCKVHHAKVTGVDTGDKLKKMTALGFDRVIDYKEENFTKLEEKYDLILDAKSKHSVRAYLRVLKKNGKYVSVGGDTSRILAVALMHYFTSKRVSMLALSANKGLDKIQELYLDGKLMCPIDGPYTFEQIPWAIQYFGDGMHAGKIVIDMMN